MTDARYERFVEQVRTLGIQQACELLCVEHGKDPWFVPYLATYEADERQARHDAWKEIEREWDHIFRAEAGLETEEA
jgi:hypothetical protein